MNYTTEQWENMVVESWKFCTTNNYVVGGTLFPHQNIHNVTWHSPNLRDKNQIDHIMINGKWRRSINRCKSEERC